MSFAAPAKLTVNGASGVTFAAPIALIVGNDLADLLQRASPRGGVSKRERNQTSLKFSVTGGTVKIEAPKPNLAYRDRDFAFHEAFERVLREIPADANAKDRWGKINTINHADDPRPANAPPEPDLLPSNDWPAAMVARRSTGSGAA